MVQYADYMYYVDVFKGNTIPVESFDQIVMKASAFVRQITFNQIEEPIIDDVKDAVCSVCDVIFEDERILKRTNGKDVKSENIDGYSVTYVAEAKDGQTHNELLERKMYSAARMYLLHTGLLYCGV